MDISAFRDELKLRLTGNVIDLELNDAALDGCINSAFRQVQRYIDTTRTITIPYTKCIDMKPYKVSSVSRVFRTEGYLYGGDTVLDGGVSNHDPMHLASWQMLSGAVGVGSQVSEWASSLGAYNTALQIRNTLSTDLLFRYDKHDDRLYINCPFDNPKEITVEYVPRYDDVSQIVSDFWIDIELRLALAICKQVIGRIRKKYTQSNALWALDTDILQEGIDEEKELQEAMRKASQLCYPVD